MFYKQCTVSTLLQLGAGCVRLRARMRVQGQYTPIQVKTLLPNIWLLKITFVSLPPLSPHPLQYSAYILHVSISSPTNRLCVPDKGCVYTVERGRWGWSAGGDLKSQMQLMPSKHECGASLHVGTAINMAVHDLSYWMNHIVTLFCLLILYRWSSNRAEAKTSSVLSAVQTS